jgi:tRNA pseudouridine32 synthase/23S rRNA pseudouridine746 synthase
MPPSQAIEELYRDEHLVAIAKPAELSLLADRSGAPCLWDALPALLRAKPFLVHRLDKGTSGVLLIGLDQKTQSALTRQFNRRAVRKFYVARVSGHLEANGTLTVDLPLKRGRKSRYRVAGQRSAIERSSSGWHIAAPDPDGLASVTRLRVLEGDPASTLLLLEPLTGRTHQLRVHLSWIGHPILGDTLYGKPGDPAQAAPRLHLHCHRLVVPGFGSFRAPLPADWTTPRDR